MGATSSASSRTSLCSGQVTKYGSSPTPCAQSHITTASSTPQEAIYIICELEDPARCKHKEGSRTGVRKVAHMQQAAVVTRAGQVEGGAAGALMAAQRRALFAAELALDHTPPTHRLRGTLYCAAEADVHLCQTRRLFYLDAKLRHV